MHVNLSDSVRNEVRKITENKAFYAAAGAGDLAVEKLRTLPDLVARLQETVPGRVQRLQTTLPGEVSRLQETIRYRLADQGQGDLASLSGRAVEYVTVVSARAVQTYDELAERGKTVAGRAARLDPQQVATDTAAEIEAAAKSAARNALRTANRTVDAARETAMSRAPMIARTLGNGKTQPAGGAKAQVGSRSTGTGAAASHTGSAGKASSGGAGKSAASRGSGSTRTSPGGGGSTAKGSANSRSRPSSTPR